MLPAYALVAQGRCYVISVGGTYRSENLPESLAELHFPQLESDAGGSCIFGPGGEAIAQAPGGEEAIITAAVTLEATTSGKLMNDAVGHYSRPDVFQLTVNRRPLEATTFVDDETAFPLAAASATGVQSSEYSEGSESDG